MKGTSVTDVLPLFHELQDTLNEEVLERRQEIHTAVLSLLGSKHHFQLGPPGTAKSYLIGRLVKRLGEITREDYFHWLLTQYTTPEELYGGPDLMLLSETGKYKRVTERKLPRATIVFLDEIFKGNSSILNANLTAMNEREFENMEDDPGIPLVSLFAASNELPAGEDLWALWDRLHFRHEIKPLQEGSNFYRMISHPADPDPRPILTLADIATAQIGVNSVEVPADIYEAIKHLRDDLHKEGIEPTERRWVEAIGIVRAEAYFNGRDIADTEDVRPLMHVLWNDLEEIPKVKKTVLELANPIDKAASDLLDRLQSVSQELADIIADGDDNQRAIARQSVETQKKLAKCNQTRKMLKKQEAESGKQSEYLAMVDDKFKLVVLQLAENGLGIDADRVRRRVADPDGLDELV
jgi:MoxR-like ATPase